jgi:hypothetical protein
LDHRQDQRVFSRTKRALISPVASSITVLWPAIDIFPLGW